MRRVKDEKQKRKARRRGELGARLGFVAGSLAVRFNHSGDCAPIKSLAHVNLQRLSYAGRVDALTALDKHISWLQAQQHRLLAVIAADPVVRGPVGELDKQWVREDVAAATFMTAVDALARRVSCDDDRTADQRRADAAVQLALNTLHGSTAGELPREHGLRPSVQVTVALSTLLGLDEQPGELDGSGPIPASVARRIAADETGTWRHLITDERGHLLDYGRSTYRPPEDLTERVIARDRTCRFRTATAKPDTANSTTNRRGNTAARPASRT